MANMRTGCATDWMLVVMLNKAYTVPKHGDLCATQKTSHYAYGKIWKVLDMVQKKYRGGSFLDKIKLGKNKLTVVIKKGEHLDKKFAKGFVIQARNMHKKRKFTNIYMVCQIIKVSIDPYTNFYYTKIVLEDNRKHSDTTTVFKVLQGMGK